MEGRAGQGRGVRKGQLYAVTALLTIAAAAEEAAGGDVWEQHTCHTVAEGLQATAHPQQCCCCPRVL